jgi:uncharacterized membrane protein
VQTQPSPTTTRVSPRYAWSVLLGIIGLFNIGIGVAILFGGAWTAVVVGGVLTLYALVLALPDNKLWG